MGYNRRQYNEQRNVRAFAFETEPVYPAVVVPFPQPLPARQNEQQTEPAALVA